MRVMRGCFPAELLSEEGFSRRTAMISVSLHAAEQQPFLTPQEVSDLLRVSVYTVRRWIKEGELPAYKVGRGWRISEADLERWLSSQRIVSMAGS
jgi:excisionase family DNA binding protein